MKKEISEAAKAARNDYYKQLRRSMTPEKKQKQREYTNQWRKKNPDKVRQYSVNYWERKANELKSSDKPLPV